MGYPVVIKAPHPLNPPLPDWEKLKGRGGDD